MVIMIFSGSVNGGQRRFADSNCLKKSKIKSLSADARIYRNKGELKWKKAKKFARQNSIAIAVVFMNISNALKKKMGHPSVRRASETVSKNVRHNL